MMGKGRCAVKSLSKPLIPSDRCLFSGNNQNFQVFSILITIFSSPTVFSRMYRQANANQIRVDYSQCALHTRLVMIHGILSIRTVVYQSPLICVLPLGFSPTKRSPWLGLDYWQYRTVYSPPDCSSISLFCFTNISDWVFGFGDGSMTSSPRSVLDPIFQCVVAPICVVDSPTSFVTPSIYEISVFYYCLWSYLISWKSFSLIQVASARPSSLVFTMFSFRLIVLCALLYLYRIRVAFVYCLDILIHQKRVNPSRYAIQGPLKREIQLSRLQSVSSAYKCYQSLVFNYSSKWGVSI